MGEGGLERKLLPFCRNGKVSFWCNRGASCSCYLWQCRGALCPLEQGEPWPPAQHPVHPEFTAELSDCFFLSAIGFLFPSFRWSVGMQLCDQRCKLYSVHMSSVACVQQASEGNRWLENMIYKMWSVWTQTLHSENGYESWSLEGKIKGPSFLAYGRECALSFKVLWGILSAPTCNCILQPDDGSCFVLLASVFQHC